MDGVDLRVVNTESTKQPPRINNNVMGQKDAVADKRHEGAAANAPESYDYVGFWRQASNTLEILLACLVNGQLHRRLYILCRPNYVNVVLEPTTRTK